MRKILCFVAMAITALGASAQKTVKFEDAQARAFDVVPNSYVKPLTVELKVDEAKGRITDVWEIKPEDMLALINEKDPAEVQKQNLRNYAVYKSSQKHNCDVIVAPVFNIRTEDVSKGVTVTIVGFTANFVNWKTMDEKDVLWMNIERADPRKVGQTYTPVYNPGR
mgnify:FL=1